MVGDRPVFRMIRVEGSLFGLTSLGSEVLEFQGQDRSPRRNLAAHSSCSGTSGYMRQDVPVERGTAEKLVESVPVDNLVVSTIDLLPRFWGFGLRAMG